MHGGEAETGHWVAPGKAFLYDDENVFAGLLRGETPYEKVYEDRWALAFNDVPGQAPVHVLVIPRGRYISFAHFMVAATAPETLGFWSAVNKVTHRLGLLESGHRIIINTGPDGAQTVGHFHVHVLGGRPFTHDLVSARGEDDGSKPTTE